MVVNGGPYGWGGPLINIPSGPTFVRTVNGPNMLALSKGDPFSPCSVFGVGGVTPYKHSIWADVCENSNWAEKP